MRNAWAEPEGYELFPRPVFYRIGRPGSDATEVHRTEQANDPVTKRWHHSLNHVDRALAVAIRTLVQRACGYFYAPDDEYEPLEGVPDVVVSDDEVRDRIRRGDLGENTREAVRSKLPRYPLQGLPWDQQRALVEHIELLKREWRFELIGEEAPVEPVSPGIEPPLTIEDVEAALRAQAGDG